MKRPGQVTGINALAGMLCCILLILATPLSGEAGRGPAYKQYVNARFNYVISYPAGLLVPQGEADNGDGQRFLSRDGSAEMLVWGSNNALNETLRSSFGKESRERTREHPDRVVTYKRLKGNAYVVSGYQDGKVFYRKTMLADDVFISFYLSYPVDRKGEFDPVTAEISSSFRFAGSSARPAGPGF
jgi:hypothetical protein